MSAKSLSNFTAELRSRNISRPNLYYIDIVLPPKMLGLPSAADAGLVSMWCHMAQTPQSTILTQDNHVEAGVKRKYAYDQDWQNLTLSFYVDQEYKIKKFFDDWKSTIVPTNRNFGYPDDYTSDALYLYIINQADETTYKYTYSRIFPKSINQIDLSYAEGETVSTFSVDFVFEEVYSTPMVNGVVPTNKKPSEVTISEDRNGNVMTNREVAIQQIPSAITDRNVLVSQIPR